MRVAAAAATKDIERALHGTPQQAFSTLHGAWFVFIHGLLVYGHVFVVIAVSVVFCT